SYYPQPVRGFIARCQGELTSWKPSPVVSQSLGRLPDHFIAVSHTDPRPTIRQVLAVAPMVMALVNSFNKELNLDVGSLPNSQEVNRHLFPNVSVVTDDGKVVRLHSRSSLPLPLDLTGLDTYALFLAFSVRAF